MIKININEKFKEHMTAHNNELLKGYEEYLDNKRVQAILQKECTKEFNIVPIMFDEYVGYTNVIAVNKNDNFFWAKRHGRSVYSRFVKNKKPQLVKCIIFILKQQKYDKNVFNLLSMYPSINGRSEKEIFDSNIDSLEELDECINYWSNHAFVGDFVQGTDKDILEFGGIVMNKEYYNKEFKNENHSNNTEFERLSIKNLYYYSKTIKVYDEFGDFKETECRYTGMRFNYMCNSECMMIGYAGNASHDFVEEMYC